MTILVDLQEGEEPLWHPQTRFVDSHLSPTSLAAREQSGPTGEQEVSVHCRTGDVLHTRVSEATKAEDVSLGLSSPCWQQDSPKPG